MPHDDPLFALVKSLSKGEKRHFKLQSSTHRGQKNYERVFDAISGMETFDRTALKRQFADEKMVKQLHVTKNYLRSLIMKSLRGYHADASKSAQARACYRNAVILYHKELYALSSEELGRAEQIAVRHELLGLLIDICELKRTLIQVAEPHQFANLAEVNQQQAIVIEMLANRNAYVSLIIDISEMAYGSGGSAIKNIHLLEDHQNAQTLDALVLHYNALYFLQLQRGETMTAGHSMQNLLNRLEEDPDRIKEMPGLYASSINNFLSYYVYRQEYQRALDLIERAKEIYRQWHVKSENRSLLRQILRTHTIELEIVRNHSLFDVTLDDIDRIAFHVESTLSRIPNSYRMLLSFQLAYIYFMRGAYKQAQHWVDPLIQQGNRTQRIDLQVHARMLNLMIHYELDSMFVMRYFVDSARRYLKKYKKIEPYESVMLRFFSAIGRTGVLDRRSRFRDLYQKLFPGEGPGLIPDEALGFINYRQWLERKI